MKNNDTLLPKTLTPKKEIIDFLLNFSRNVQPIKTKNHKVVLVSKN